MADLLQEFGKPDQITWCPSLRTHTRLQLSELHLRAPDLGQFDHSTWEEDIKITRLAR